METVFITVLIALAIILVVAWLITFIINNFIPVDGKIKQLINALIWIVALIAIIAKVVLPLLALI